MSRKLLWGEKCGGGYRLQPYPAGGGCDGKESLKSMLFGTPLLKIAIISSGCDRYINDLAIRSQEMAHGLLDVVGRTT